MLAAAAQDLRDAQITCATTTRSADTYSRTRIKIYTHTHSLTHAHTRTHAQTDLDVVVGVQKDVLRLEVAVQRVLGVDVCQPNTITTNRQQHSTYDARQRRSARSIARPHPRPAACRDALLIYD